MGHRWRLLMAWRGDAYVGWQRQPNGRSVQATVESAISRFFGGVTVHAKAAGRLDAGVHSRGQVVAVDVPEARSARAWIRGLSALLPGDIGCLAVAPCALGFNPRRAALGKHYRYRWREAQAPCPFRRLDLWHIRRPLDVEAMQQAARSLVGTHDFTSFRASGCSAHTPIRTIDQIEVRRHDDEVIVDVFGPGFLRHQVRIIAGTLAEVGGGARAAQSVAGLLESPHRSRAGVTAPPHGLWLQSVHFDPPLAWEHAL